LPVKKDNQEIALDVNGNIDPNKYWFNIEGFERDPAKTPTSFQTRAFPFQIDRSLTSARPPSALSLPLEIIALRLPRIVPMKYATKPTAVRPAWKPSRRQRDSIPGISDPMWMTQ
jgi:hypothetical protein